jgi:hypothetical protein
MHICLFNLFAVNFSITEVLSSLKLWPGERIQISYYYVPNDASRYNLLAVLTFADVNKHIQCSRFKEHDQCISDLIGTTNAHHARKRDRIFWGL